MFCLKVKITSIKKNTEQIIFDKILIDKNKKLVTVNFL